MGRLDHNTIYDALVTVPWKHVCHWLENNLGQTHQSKRRLAYKTPDDKIATKSA